jgi:hypothetical protein
LEIAQERQAELLGGGGQKTSLRPENVVQVRIGEDGRIHPDHAGSRKEAAGEGGLVPVTTAIGAGEDDTPWLDTALLTTSLTAIHFTLEVLTVHQYAQELRFAPIFAHTLFVALPTLGVLVSLFHGLLLPASLTQRLPVSWKVGILALRSLLYVVIANVAGCHLIQLTNDKGYYAVMKDAPGVGTIWVWAVIELGLLGALAGVIGPGIYAWWNGYGVV